MTTVVLGEGKERETERVRLRMICHVTHQRERDVGCYAVAASQPSRSPSIEVVGTEASLQGSGLGDVVHLHLLQGHVHISHCVPDVHLGAAMCVK
jgi:hypothetical protein